MSVLAHMSAEWKQLIMAPQKITPFIPKNVASYMPVMTMGAFLLRPV